MSIIEKIKEEFIKMTYESEAVQKYKGLLEKLKEDTDKQIETLNETIRQNAAYIDHLLKVIDGKDQTIKNLQKEKEHLKATIHIFDRDQRRKKVTK